MLSNRKEIAQVYLRFLAYEFKADPSCMRGTWEVPLIAAFLWMGVYFTQVELFTLRTDYALTL